MSLGLQKLKEYMELKGWNQSDLSKKLGYKQNMTVSHVLTGNREPSWQMAEKVYEINKSIKTSDWKKPAMEKDNAS